MDNSLQLQQRLAGYKQRIGDYDHVKVEGKITRSVGLTLEAVGCTAAIGSICYVESQSHEMVEAEVVGFSGEKLYLMPIETTIGLAPGAKILATGKVADVPVGPQLLGRVLDGLGKPLDNKGPLTTESNLPIVSKPINPLTRNTINEPLDVGVRAVNGLFSVGRGQRMGLFAGSGVGKSVLLGMMTRFTAADVIVVGLIGERGREVKEFIEQSLGEAGLARSVVIAAPADTSPLMRLRGAMHATTIAEYFRDQGSQVLLLMDSLTRYAQAQRELALAIGEPPATRGYPPSVFAKLPKLVERAGNAAHGKGSITAFYTVLIEGDDQQDPIGDAARAILDGHLVLSRSLAEAGHYPAIDIEASISRVIPNITTPEHQVIINQFKHYYSKFQQSKELIQVGAYVKGSDPELDKAIELMPLFNQYSQQDMKQKFLYSDSISALEKLMPAVK